MAEARKKRILWTRDELILVLSLYKRTFPENPDENERVQYSIILDEMAKKEGLGDARSPGSVGIRVSNFAYLNDNDPRKGLSGVASNELAIGIWNEFKDEFAKEKINKEGKLEKKEGRLEKEVEPILASIISDIRIEDPMIYDACSSVLEGKEVIRKHKFYERNPKIIKKKKEKVKREKGFLACEACGFNFAKTYGSYGEDFIECHHKNPMAQKGKSGETSLDDLALVCSNCHRMIHRSKDFLTIEQLKEKIDKAKSK